MNEPEKIKEGIYKLDKNTHIARTKWGWEVRKYLKKDITKPFKNNINWMNLIVGNKLLLFVMFFIIIISLTYMYDTKECRDLLKNPIPWCGNWMGKQLESVGCSLDQEKLGLCSNQTIDIDVFNWSSIR